MARDRGATEGPALDRRHFLGCCACASAAAATAGLLLEGHAHAATLGEHPARFYKRLPQKRVECELCPKHCRVDDTERGFCGVRENQGGEYRSLVYGRPVTMNMDPIEKKPLFHMLPGAWTFSIATVGCNLDCKACQNWQISQARPEQVHSYDMPPQKLVRAAKDAGSAVLSYTYTEPMVYLEYVIDCAREAKQQGLKNCVISGGTVEQAPLKEACKVLDAVKIDLKSFSDATYVKMNKGNLNPVLAAIETVKRSGPWLELVYLVIPTVNDSDDEVKRMCRWVGATLGKDVPLHFTRFHPDYQLKHLPPTPLATLKRCFELARAEGLHFPYVGNVDESGGEDTRCPKCGHVVVERRGFTVQRNALDHGHCPKCKTQIPGRWIA